MLLRISIFVALLAAIGVVAFNFSMVKNKVVTLAQDRDNQRDAKEKAQHELADTRATLRKTTTELNQTKTELASTKDQLSVASKQLASVTTERDSARKERDTARKERDDARDQLAAYEGTGLKPEQIIAMNGQYKSLQAENQVLAKIALERAQKIRALTNELAIYKNPEYFVPLPADLRGKVLVTDPKWNFVVLNIGQDQGVLEHGELLVNRDGRLVAKVIVRSVEKSRSIANVMPGWQLGEVMEGDEVIPAHPEIKETTTGITAVPALDSATQVTAVRQ
jgi:hypothetical protein